MAYQYQEYPKAKYHIKKDPVLVVSEEDELTLGDDWFDHPDEAKRPRPKPPVVPPAPAPAMPVAPPKHDR